jgi:hypothetical protein
VLDSTPGVCGGNWAGATDVCPAHWALAGTSVKKTAPRLPGVGRYREDAHTLLLSNHRGYFSSIECRHEFLGYCDEDDAGRPRMPSGVQFHLPGALRVPSPTADRPRIRVAILGAVHDRCATDVHGERHPGLDPECADEHRPDVALTAPAHGFDMARICRIE